MQVFFSSTDREKFFFADKVGNNVLGIIFRKQNLTECLKENILLKSKFFTIFHKNRFYCFHSEENLREGVFKVDNTQDNIYPTFCENK